MLDAFSISAIDRNAAPALQHVIDQKTKPLGALGQIEQLALQVALIQQRATPEVIDPALLVFAGDHGITEEGVSAYPSAVTAQMVANFAAGGAAVNVFAAQHEMALSVFDVGVAADLELTGIHEAKVRAGTRNFLRESAMTEAEFNDALRVGAQAVRERADNGCNVIGFGEMGIGNTSAAAMLMSFLCDLEVDACVGAGTGLDSQGLKHKATVLAAAKARIQAETDSLETGSHAWVTAIGRQCGGLEIAAIAGGMLAAAERRMVILVDGFIATSALLLAVRAHESVRDYCVFSHCSDEQGHTLMLSALDAEPLLRLGMRLGEGSATALALPLVVSAVRFLNDMASFEDAGVSGPADPESPSS